MCLPCWRPLGTMRDNAMFLGFWFLLHVFFARFFSVYLGSCTSTWSHRRRLHASSDATTSNTSDFMSWLLFTFFFMWYPVSLASLWKKGTRTSPWIASCGTKRSSCGSCFLASCSFFACFFVLFVLAEAPTVGKAPVNVKAMPSMPPVSRWIHCRLFFVNCIIECFAWSFLQGCGCLASQDRYVGSCSLIYILIYFNVHCMFFCMIGFLFRTKRKRKLPWMIAPGYLVLHVLHVLHVFLMFPFLFQELKELGKEVDKLKKVCFFFECLWSRNKNFLLGIVCCQEKENISTLNAEYVKVCFWTCFLCKKKYFFSCVYCHSRSLKVSTSWRLFLVYRNWISYFTCIYIFFVYLRRRIAWKLNTKIWPRTVCLHVFFLSK